MCSIWFCYVAFDIESLYIWKPITEAEMWLWQRLVQPATQMSPKRRFNCFNVPLYPYFMSLSYSTGKSKTEMWKSWMTFLPALEFQGHSSWFRSLWLHMLHGIRQNLAVSSDGVLIPTLPTIWVIEKYIQIDWKSEILPSPKPNVILICDFL